MRSLIFQQENLHQQDAQIDDQAGKPTLLMGVEL